MSEESNEKMNALLKKLRGHSLGTVNSSIGKLAIFGLVVRDSQNLIKDLALEVKDCAPEQYARTLAKYACYPFESLIEGFFKPDTPLTEEQIHKLTNEDLESIADVYVNGSPYLFRESIRNETVNEKGEKGIKFEDGNIIHPREESEPSITYLHRLATLKRAKDEAFYRKLSPFSMSLNSRISETQFLGKTLLERLNLGSTNKIFSGMNIGQSFRQQAKLEVPSYDFVQIARDQERARRKPFESLGDRLEKSIGGGLDEIVTTSKKTLEYIVLFNQIQTDLASELKSSADRNETLSKRNLILTTIVLLVTILGITLSSYFSYQSLIISKQSQVSDNSTEIELYLKSIDSTLKEAQKNK